ncbi:VDE lipocalin domain-containing protein [Fragilaria crotonensis]|nr:VDE lipocalin domain-containing protein [Fragilaria crotonensis]
MNRCLLMPVLLVATCYGFIPQPQSGLSPRHLSASTKHDFDKVWKTTGQALATVAFGLSTLITPVAFADTPAQATANYDGFAEYAKENKMEQSDVGCFINKCGEQTKNLFSNPRGIKGVSCLGRCKGEQSCATRCFAEYGSEDLNNWLSCTIEENECVKVPKNIDNSAENVGYDNTVKNFDPKSLIGKWYKTDGLNPNYDLFPCQANVFTATNDDASELDMDIYLRILQPKESGGGFWNNQLKEHMLVDAAQKNVPNPTKRTMHTSGKMYGLSFYENWYIVGESDGSNGIPPFKLVAYKGHTLQGNYEGSFVYAKEPQLPKEALPAVREAAAKVGLDFDKFTRIDNTCPVGEALNDSDAGTGTSTTDWINLVIGEGGVIDWISPGWRGEYVKK